ncbi:hypothetical protein [Massilia arenae]|uniref:Uncharacterized protein n=1 Tax=Massilia arenae TaxID=2603288 RepID=A0A5C7FZG1_9BURK|nr:hypothetical protein [Massilia arenae]TXG00839.1 hypothetical protein FVD38_06660 [Massilia arenae]
MRIDQPRQQDHPTRIDPLRPRRLEPAPNRNNPPIPYQHIRIAPLTLLRIKANDIRVLNQQATLLPKNRLTRRKQQPEHNTMQKTRHGNFQTIKLPPILQPTPTEPRALTAQPNPQLGSE